MDSSYHIQPNISGRRDTIRGNSVHGIHERERERDYFSMLCTFIKVIDFFQVKVDIQKKALRFTNKKKIDTIFVSFIQFAFLIHHCHKVKVLNDYLVHSC